MGVTRDEVVGMPTASDDCGSSADRSRSSQRRDGREPIYRQADAAKSAGFENIPVPPTYCLLRGDVLGRVPQEDQNPPTRIPGATRRWRSSAS